MQSKKTIHYRVFRIKRYLYLAWKFKTIRDVEKLQRKWKNGKDRMRRKRQRERFFAENSKCNYCPEMRRDKLSIDHIIPKSKGGAKGKSNWQVLCKKCNNKKADKLVF